MFSSDCKGGLNGVKVGVKVNLSEILRDLKKG